MAELDLRKPQFVLSEVLRSVNIGHQRLTSTVALNWLKGGYLKGPAKQSPGSGRSRLYSALDAVQIAALFHMTSGGVQLYAASLCLHLFNDSLADRLRESPRNLRAEFGDDRLYIYFDPALGEVQVSRVRDKGIKTTPWLQVPTFTSVNMDAIIDSTMGELAKIVAGRRVTATAGRKAAVTA